MGRVMIYTTAIASARSDRERGMVVPQLEKVTAFVTRGSGDAAELLVFRHERSGVQVPAGTVEAGEPPAAAVRRELAEESGLTAVRLVQTLGRFVDDLTPEERGVLRTEPLRSAPAADAPPAGGRIYRGMTVPCTEEAAGYVRVGLLEWEDLEHDPLMLASEQWGWVPAGSVCGRRVRSFYHFAPTAPTPDAWSQHMPDGDNGDFELYWVPLVPRPRLVRPQDQWLEAWYRQLLDGTSSA
jgi:8-oxo-dGTP pyrophosphatase MutT (NUDIX family)